MKTPVADYIEDCWRRGEWPPPPGTYKVERTINLGEYSEREEES